MISCKKRVKVLLLHNLSDHDSSYYGIEVKKENDFSEILVNSNEVNDSILIEFPSSFMQKPPIHKQKFFWTLNSDYTKNENRVYSDIDRMIIPKTNQDNLYGGISFFNELDSVNRWIYWVYTPDL